jgi:hypothetical protein
MTEPLDFPPAVEADLVALADDCLSPCRRAELEARVAGDATLTAALENQREALALLAGTPPRPSAALRARVDELAADAPQSSLRPRRAAVGVVAALAMLAGALGPPPRTLDNSTLRGAPSGGSTRPGAARPRLFLVASPASFTGQDQVQLGAHGAPEPPRIRAGRPAD